MVNPPPRVGAGNAAAVGTVAPGSAYPADEKARATVDVGCWQEVTGAVFQGMANQWP